MKVSIITPIFQFTDELFGLTREMFLSLDETKGEDTIETIIIDNGSPIGADYLRDNSDIYIRNEKNMGYGRAFNQGLKVSSGELIVGGNNDIRVSSNWLEVAKDIFKTYPEVGSVHYRMIPYDQDFNPGSETWVDGKERWCSTSFFVMKKEVVDKVGFFDEKFDIFGYDDWDYWSRVRATGFKTAYTNKAEYQHMDSSTNNQLNQVERQASVDKNREYYKEKHSQYPEDHFAQQFPEQMAAIWKPFP